jgi:hypothetical protein
MTVHLHPVLVLLAVIGVGASVSSAADPAAIDFFETKVRPLLSEHCYSCHGPQKQKSALRLDHISLALKGGENGPALVPGHPEKSRLIEGIGYANVDFQMPPKKKLPDADIAVLTKWVQDGAAWPSEPVPALVKADKSKGFDLQARREAHWSWKPIKATAPPKVKDAAWAVEPIDAFVQRQLEAAGIHHAPPADRAALIRRVYFDLIGLPPTPAEVETFLADTSADAYEKVVDRLLKDPHFGERWARHWMDQMRYAETLGHEFDYPVPNAFKYRDYLIRAFNADVPYNQFALEHIAGDLLEKPRLNPTEGYNESVIATGSWFFGEQTHAPVDVKLHQSDRVDNQIDTLTKSFLALTVGCARCHDHKFDAISTQDYYALYGFLESSRMATAQIDAGGKIAAAVAQLTDLKKQGDAIVAGAPPAKPPADGPDVVFEDFEKATYDGWTAEGTAFGEGPVTRQTLPPWQGDVGAVGDRFVNSHNARSGEDVIHADAHTGTLTSKPFKIDRAFIRMLIGGGSHRGKTGVELLIDDKAVAEINGRDNNRMAPAEIAVGQWSGKEARLRIFDRETGPWGNVGVDQVVFTNKSLTAGPNGGAGADAPLSANTVVFEDFAKSDLSNWYPSGPAFDGGPTREKQWDPTAAAPHFVQPGLARTGLLSPKLRGAIRSRTFTITHNNIHAWVGGKGKMRVVIETYIMDNYSGLLFGGLIQEVNTPGQMGWRTIGGGDFARHLGQRAYLEFGDEGDGELALGRVLFSNDGPPGDAPRSMSGPAVDLAPDALAKLESIRAQMQQISAQVPAPQEVLAIADGSGIDEHVFIRGKANAPGEIAPRRFLEAIAGPSQPPVGEKTSGRLQLAQRVTDPANPFFSRVIVNRIWQHMTGVGIVPTVDNFGVQGQPPTNPALLDYLAAEFMKDGWSMKRLIRRVALSQTYRMSSKPADAAAEKADPANALMHRMNIRRLEGEAIRDELLAVSGRLDPALYGPSIGVYLTPFMQGRGRPGGGPLDGNGRRSVYTEVRRNFLSPMMLAFDTPIPFQGIGRRNISNVPAQALILMNDPLVVEQARVWAKRIVAVPNLTPEQRVAAMYLAAFGRPPEAGESQEAAAFLAEQAKLYGLPADKPTDDERVWADFAHVLFNVKEFVFIR